MRQAVTGFGLLLALLVCCGAQAQTLDTTGSKNSTNKTIVDVSIVGVGEEVNGDQMGAALNESGWDVKVVAAEFARDARVAPAGNTTKPNCTLASNTTECQPAEASGLTWWAWTLIVLGSLMGAAGLGVLIWWLYITYTPNPRGYTVVPTIQRPPDPRVIHVALVTPMCPHAFNPT